MGAMTIAMHIIYILYTYSHGMHALAICYYNIIEPFKCLIVFSCFWLIDFVSLCSTASRKLDLRKQKLMHQIASYITHLNYQDSMQYAN